MPDTTAWTHPEIALWIALVPICLTMASILLLSLLLQGQLLYGFRQLIDRRVQRQTPGLDPALFWTPVVTTPEQLLACCLAAAMVTLVLCAKLGPWLQALLLAGPVAGLLVWGFLRLAESRYRARLDRALPAAASRLAAQLRAGDGITDAMMAVTRDLPEQPLTIEWRFVRERIGKVLQRQTLVSESEAILALSEQTPSLRHRRFLRHLGVATDQPRDVLINRTQAAAHALHAAERRRSEALTELAQMRISGWLVGGLGLFMGAMLALSQGQRFASAFSGPAGQAVGAIILGALLLPIVGGEYLARVEDLDY